MTARPQMTGLPLLRRQRGMMGRQRGMMGWTRTCLPGRIWMILMTTNRLNKLRDYVLIWQAGCIACQSVLFVVDILELKPRSGIFYVKRLLSL